MLITEESVKNTHKQSNNATKFKLNIPKIMEFQMTFIISMLEFPIDIAFSISFHANGSMLC